MNNSVKIDSNRIKDNIYNLNKVICIIDNRINDKPIPLSYYINILTPNTFHVCNACSAISEYSINDKYYCWKHAQNI